jgi:DNA-nicking Smr family endonuclease
VSGDDEKSFAEAMRGVKPLEGREKLRPPSGSRPAPPAETPARPRPFVVERNGDDVFARREDVSRKQLAELRAGRPQPECELDLHGLSAGDARRELLACLERARRDGVRCMLVIHGAGQHSEAGPVLKTALPDWLQEEGVAGGILAFATAPSRPGGGTGATLVLLRRKRRR